MKENNLNAFDTDGISRNGFYTLGSCNATKISLSFQYQGVKCFVNKAPSPHPLSKPAGEGKARECG
jgi:hypothetical protein